MTLRNWFGSSTANQTVTRSRRATPKRTPRCLLAVERLEDRLVPTASISIAGATLNEVGTPSPFVTPGSGGLSSPVGITVGPDGNAYVAANGGAVLRYNGTSGQYINTFVALSSGGLGYSGTQAGLAFGPDGNLYVTSASTNQVLEYNGSSGAFSRVYVSAGSGGLTFPRGLTFGPDGNLYVTSYDAGSGANGVMRYQGPSAASPGAPLPGFGQSGAAFTPTFAPQATDGGGPREPIFGPDGNLYVDGGNNQGIKRYDGATGAFLDTFIDRGSGNLLSSGRGIAFDQEGHLYVGDSSDAVHRYDAQGNFLGDLLVSSVNPSLAKPLGLTFDARGSLLIACSNSSSVVRYDRGVVVSLSEASITPITVDYATSDGSALAGADYFALSGTVTFAPGQTTRRILLATQEEAALGGNETFNIQLGNSAGGATIAAGSATVTILEPTRQFSVANATGVEGDHAAHYRGAIIQGIISNAFTAVAFGPDGNLYTSAGGLPGLDGNAVGRFNGSTGAFINEFEQGHNGQVRHMAFQGGYLYLATAESNDVVRFDATTGAFVDVFITAGSGGLNGPNGLIFGPDANSDGIPDLYVSGSNSNNVIRYDGVTGAPLRTYVASGSGGLNLPVGIAFDPSGSYLYVASSGSNQILKYNAQTGAYVGVAAGSGLSGPADVKFGADGLLYVLSPGNDRLLRFTTSGVYVDDYVPAGSGGMAQVNSMAFGPDGDLYVAAANPSQIMRFGTESEALFTVTNTTVSTLPLTVNYATSDGSALAGSDYAATNGTLTFAPGVTSEIIRIPILDDSLAESTETFTVSLSSPSGATIADGQAVGTIEDNDAAKFYVVNDSSTDQTYRYGAPGNPLGNSALGSGDTAPRGAASNAAGAMVWVVDANQKVYVYNPGGALLGSWTPGGLNASAQVEGIATNGADIWLLDNKQDKVYKYTGAASRLSGSQSAANSFSLNSGNSNGKGIVTDGVSIWTVDDGSSTDKVYKYTVSGTSQSSWTIDAANSHPTGLTINPASVSDIWIVDNGTDKVYQYAAAAGRTSGSQNAAATFALAAGNTNPQDIADPPAPDMAIPASDDSTAPIHPAVARSLPITGTVPSVQTLSPNPGFVGWLAQTQPAAPNIGGGLAQAVTQAPVLSLAPVTLAGVPAMKATPETGLMPTGTSIPHHQIVDLVFSDPSLGSIDFELLGRA
jgi:sugar lactone lactonase YvrE